MDSFPPLERAIRIAGSESKLAAAIGYSQVAINKARRHGALREAMHRERHARGDRAAPPRLVDRYLRIADRGRELRFGAGNADGALEG